MTSWSMQNPAKIELLAVEENEEGIVAVLRINDDDESSIGLTREGIHSLRQLLKIRLEQIGD